VTPNSRGLWLAFAVLAALVIALIAGALSYLDNRRVPAAVIRGGIAFGATIGCLLGIFAYLA
jgi:hypothetical protein